MGGHWQILGLARQLLSLVAGGAIDDWLAQQLRTLRQEHTLSRLILSLQASLWPGGTWFLNLQEPPPVRPPPPADGPQLISYCFIPFIFDLTCVQTVTVLGAWMHVTHYLLIICALFALCALCTLGSLRVRCNASCCSSCAESTVAHYTLYALVRDTHPLGAPVSQTLR